KLFAGTDGYAHGEQQRDFVSVEDVVKVNLHFLEHPQYSGIYNVGTGHAQSFNDVAVATINACRRLERKPAASLDELKALGAIEYVPFPDALKGKYQSYTEADITALREADYRAPFLSVAEGVERYVDELLRREGKEG